MRKFSVSLPVIPEPPSNTRSVLVQQPSSKPFPYLKSQGPADLLCGRCGFKLATGMGPGQIQNLVLKCPSCESFNDVPFVPALESLVSELLLAQDPFGKALALKQKLEAARDQGTSPKATSETIASDSEVLAGLIALLEPKTAGDFYSMLGCIITFLGVLSYAEAVEQSIGRGEPIHYGAECTRSFPEWFLPLRKR
jgi:hypothetical protein